MISVERMQELESAVEAMMKTREAEVANMGRLLQVISDLQARIMAMEKMIRVQQRRAFSARMAQG